VDGIQFTQGLERLAQVMDRATLIRTYTAGDLGFILHSRHQFQWHTGYAPPQTVACPHLGSVIARALGPKNPALPAFINIRSSSLPRSKSRAAEPPACSFLSPCLETS
jgi:hypothetical protein